MTNDNGGFIITGKANIELMRLLTLRAALKTEIRTGMQRSGRGRSTLTLVNEVMGTHYRIKKTAYEAYDKFLVDNYSDRGVTSSPLEKKEGQA